MDNVLKNKMYYAHTKENEPPKKWQPLEDHLESVADIASKCAAHFNASDWGKIVGRLHDIGKLKPAFQQKLIQNSSIHVDHKSVGAKIAYDLLSDPGKLLSYCIAGHHGGLPNWGHSRTDGSISLKALLNEAEDIPSDVVEMLIEGNRTLALPFQPTNAFQLTFFTRMLFSALVDADFLDTEHFLQPEKSDLRKPGPSLPVLLQTLENKLAGFKAEGHINRLRAEILNHCRNSSRLPPGLFTLTVPTGGGKTLSSMAFALLHAIKHGLRRIIYVIPYTSIIEQNAKVFREIFPENSVIEHHSNFDDTPSDEGKDQQQATLRHRLACENWDAPVVVTTSVQFFESLYAAKPSRCRKLHNLAESVIILDEAQMLPVEYLNPCLRALEELSLNYRASVVLCTATQPALNKREEFTVGLEGIREIAPDPDRMHIEFRRTRLESIGVRSLDQIADLVGKKEQVLCIVNTRQRAGELFEKVCNQPGAMHLSALMCPAHRSKVISDIKQILKAGRPCRVISTPLVEAGVDLDFPEVIREIAGLDSITQAAGRCNREGKKNGLGVVTTFVPEGGVVPAFRQAASNTETTLRKYGNDPFSPAAINHFFSETYWLKKDLLDKKKILEEFNIPKPKWAFRDVGNRFRLIENDMIPIIIPFNDDAQSLITALRYADHVGGILRRLQQYTVQIYRYQLLALSEAGAIEYLNDRYRVLVDGSAYDIVFGLKISRDVAVDHSLIF